MPCCFTTCVPSDRPCSAFREQIGERHAGTRVLRRGGSKKGREQHQPLLKRRRRRKSRRGWKHCSVPCAFLHVPLRFFSVPPHFIPVHHAVPSTSPKPPQTHRPVLRCAPLLAALHITYYGLAFYPLYYVFGHYNQREERESRREHRTRTYVHGWIHESGGRRIKWHCDVFRHNVVRAICWRNLVQSCDIQIAGFQCENYSYYDCNAYACGNYIVIEI